MRAFYELKTSPLVELSSLGIIPNDKENRMDVRLRENTPLKV